MTLELNSTLCINCGRCVQACPQHILSLVHGAVSVKDKRLPSCIHCGHCVGICPQKAITLDGFDPLNLIPVESLRLNLSQRQGLFCNCRSIRRFKSGEVDKELLQAALNDAAYAATARNTRLVEWTVVYGQDKVHDLAADVAKRMESAPPPYDKMAQAFAKGKDLILRDAPCIMVAHCPEDWQWASEDCITAASYLALSLHSLGLGSCWAGMLVGTAARGPLQNLPLPQGHKAYAALMVGVANESYSYLPPRELKVHFISN